jgi:carboxylesterase
MRPAVGAVARWRPRTGRGSQAGPTTVQPGSETYRAGDGPVGVLLSHGFTGSPRSLRSWADHLAAGGFRVVVPRLPGHGTTWQEMNQTRWPDWYGRLEREFADLSRHCSPVFVGGLSMGGALALRLAEQLGERVAGLVLVNPSINAEDPRYRALPVLRHLAASVGAIGNDIAMPEVLEGAYTRTPLHAAWSLTQLWRDVAANLPRVDQPLLIYKSAIDHVVDPSSLRLILAGVSSTDVTTVPLPRSYHVATLDYDASLIFTGSSDFFQRLAKTRLT